MTTSKRGGLRRFFAVAALSFAALHASAAQYAYVANGGGRNVVAYEISPATGALTPIAGSPFDTTPSITSHVMITTSGRFLYVTPGLGANVVTGFAINQATGALTPVAGSPFAAGNRPNGIAITPDDAFVYVTNINDDNVSAYRIDPLTGALAPVPGSPFAAGNFPLEVTVAGGFVYVANAASNDISAYQINPATGALTPLAGSPFPCGCATNDLRATPDGRFLYVASGSGVTAFAINPGTGALTPVVGSPFGAGAGDVLAISPNGSYLFASNSSSNNVSGYSINGTTGALTAVPGSPFATGPQPVGVAFASNGALLYNTNLTGPNVSGFSVNAATGALTPLAGSPFAGGGITNPFGIAVVVTLTVPDAPTAAAATAGNAQATVTFVAPASNGGSPITGYTVASIPPGGVDSNAGTTATSHIVTGLANGTAYTFTVTATNAAGTSAPSAASNSVTPATIPSAPTGVTATAGNAQASVVFTAPLSNGGSPITGYSVTSIPPGGVDSNAGTAGTAHVITGLANGTAYTFTVTATNAKGTSAPSLASNSITPSFNSFTGPTATGLGNATVSFSGGGAGCSFAPQGTGAGQSAFFIPLSGATKSPPAGSAPAGVTFPYGLIDFVLVGCTPGSTVNFTVTYPTPVAATAYYKYGPTPANTAPHWYTLPATFGGNSASFSITDGQLGDDDLAANGTIVDQGGPGVLVSGIPTLSEWALMLMAALLALTGLASARRSRGTL